MTREELLKEYTLNEAGVIRNPGKFEGEMIYAPYFYNQMLDGGADETVGGTDFFVITEEDRDEFPELNVDDFGAALTESDQGFVHVSILEKHQYESLLEELTCSEQSIEEEG